MQIFNKSAVLKELIREQHYF